jgi:hypothetical protein
VKLNPGVTNWWTTNAPRSIAQAYARLSKLPALLFRCCLVYLTIWYACALCRAVWERAHQVHAVFIGVGLVAAVLFALCKHGPDSASSLQSSSAALILLLFASVVVVGMSTWYGCVFDSGLLGFTRCMLQKLGVV